MDKNDLARTLVKIDKEAWFAIGIRNPRPQVVIVGGAAFMLHDITSRRTTHDIDIYKADKSIKKILAGYPELNSGVVAYADHIPYNFEDRLIALDLDTKAIEFVTPSIEDLVVMKLYAERVNDLQDIDGAINNGVIDWNLLEYLVYSGDEARASSISDTRYKNMVAAYERLKERCGK